jgi:mono/diheme cytochrome c family protein
VRIPLIVKIGALIAATTALYTYIGQLVPQKEVAPPEVVELSKDMTTDDLVRIGRGIAEGKGLCLTCHTIGKTGALRFPDLSGIATRAGERIDGVDALTYMAQSIYHPDEYIVPGFTPGMPAINKPPIGLTDDEIKAVIAYLQSLGGEPTITLDTSVPYSDTAAQAAGS